MNIESLSENLYYTFGSWLIVHLAYTWGYTVAKDEGSPKKRWETITFIIGKMVMAFLGGLLLSSFAGFGDYFIAKFKTIEGLFQILLVMTIPIGFGIWKAIKENQAIEKDYSNKLKE